MSKSKYISQQELRELFDYSDGELLWKVRVKHSSAKIGTSAGSHSAPKAKYHQINIKGKYWQRSRLVWIWHNGDIPDNKMVDHIDISRFNDKIENLRLATRSQNSGNRRKKSGTSIYMGVSFNKFRNKWQASLNTKPRKQSHFDNEADAATWYNFIAYKHFGKFASLNIGDIVWT